MYSFDNDAACDMDCPKCKHSMQRLAQHNSIRRNEGYSLDDGTGSSNVLTYLLFGWSGSFSVSDI
jgi:hypothetical protein